MSKLYRQAHYTISAVRPYELPKDIGIEVAFVGRSNAGKSSVINTITGIKSLAKTSKTPGCTKMINFFGLDEKRSIVDLPGYGYARVSNKMQTHWQEALEEYIETRQSLRGLMLIIDIRHPLKISDILMISKANHVNLSIHILLTKADKIGRSASMANLYNVDSKLKEHDLTASVQLFSSLKNIGKNEAIKQLDSWFYNIPISSSEFQKT